MSINKRLKQIRETMKLSQKSFSQSLGVKQSYYSEVENEKRPVGRSIISSLIEKYNISSDWLLTGKGDIYINNSDNSVTGSGDGFGEEFSSKSDRGVFDNYGISVRDDNTLYTEKGSKLELLINQITNISIVENLIEDQALTKILRLLKLESVFIRLGVFPQKPIYSEFKLLLEALTELQQKYLNDDNENTISQEHLNKIGEVIKTLDITFYKRFDELFDTSIVDSELSNIKNFNDLVEYWKGISEANNN